MILLLFKDLVTYKIVLCMMDPYGGGAAAAENFAKGASKCQVTTV